MMNKVFSVRLNDSTIFKIERLAKQLGTAKKVVLEAAINHYFEQIDKDQFIDILRETCGAWKRDESPEETVAKVRSEMQKSLTRYHR